MKSSNLDPFLRGGEDGRTQALGMTLDDEGRLYIAGGFTGKVFIYDTSSENPVLIRSFGTPNAGSLLNDVTVNPRSGDAYITDSLNSPKPTIWRVRAEDVKKGSEGQLDPWLDLTDTLPDIIQYTDDGQPDVLSVQDINLNGIVATPDGRYLLTVQANTGKLYRIDTQTKQVVEINLGNATLAHGDGLVLKDDVQGVARNEDDLITEVLLDDLFTSQPSGQVKGETTVPSPAPEDADFPTTGALVGGRLLVVNSQFNEGFLKPGEPETPFTVSSLRAP